MFNLKKLLGDALFIGNVVNKNEMTLSDNFVSDGNFRTEIEKEALSMAVQLFKDIPSMAQGIESCHQNDDPIIAAELPSLEKGAPGRTELHDGFIESYNIVGETVVPVTTDTNAVVATVPTPEDGTSLVVDTVDNFIDKYEEKGLDSKSFVEKFIRSVDNIEKLQNISNEILVKQELLRKWKHMDDIDFTNKVSYTKKELNNLEKEKNKTKKEIVENKRKNKDVTVLEGTLNSFEAELQRKKLTVDIAIYANKYHKQVENTLTDLDIIQSEIDSKIQSLEKIDSEKTKKKVFEILEELESHRELLVKWLTDNKPTIETLNFSNKEIINLIDIIKQAQPASAQVKAINPLPELIEILQTKIKVDNDTPMNI